MRKILTIIGSIIFCGGVVLQPVALAMMGGGSSVPGYLKANVKRDEITIPQKATGQCVELMEGSAGGTNRVTICAPDAMPGNVTIDASQLAVAPDSLPSQTGENGKYLTTNGSASSWANPFANMSTTGVVKVGTAAPGTNTTQAASTAFVQAAVSGFWRGVLTTDPATFSNGECWYNTTRNKRTCVENGAKVTYSATAIEEAVLGFTPSSYSFGDVATGSTGQHQFTLTNSGTGTATNVALAASGVFSIYSSTCESTLAASGTCTVEMDFDPVSAQSYSGSLTASADGVATATASLSGNGTSGATYLIEENFESGTTPSGWTAVTGSPFGFTPSIDGTYSARVTNAISFRTTTFDATGDVYIAALIKVTTAIGTNNARMLSLQDSGNTNIAWLTMNSQGKLVVADSGGSTLASVASISLDTPVYVKMRYQKGTGANGILTGWTSTDGTTWTQRVQKTTSPATADAVKGYSIGDSGGMITVIDKYRISNSDINY